ncbi:hypothetical protein CU098_006991, partial [Rhizopus stolonifer]
MALNGYSVYDGTYNYNGIIVKINGLQVHRNDSTGGPIVTGVIEHNILTLPNGWNGCQEKQHLFKYNDDLLLIDNNETHFIFKK